MSIILVTFLILCISGDFEMGKYENITKFFLILYKQTQNVITEREKKS